MAAETERESNRLIESSARMRNQAEALIQQTQQFNSWWVGCAGSLIFLGGLILGHAWKARDFDSALAGIEQRLEQVQQKIDTPPPADTTRAKAQAEQ
jgi:hypothetical protein